jgi:hypothetical protein
VPDVSYQLWFAVRYVHIASAALLTGGAVLAATSCGSWAFDVRLLVDAVAAYEWTFWSVAGLAAVTGVSNLGLKGEGLLAPDTSWGVALSIKLGAVLLLLALSFIRTDIVHRCRAASHLDQPRARRVLTALYAATAVALLGALWLGLGLAHGRY